MFPRREVEALLAHAATAGGFLSGGLGVLAVGPRDLIRRRIGAFEVTARLGAGGMDI